MMAMTRFDEPSAVKWIADESALTELPRASAQAAPEEAGRLMAELAKRGVAANSQQLVRGVVQCWLRFRSPEAHAPFENARTASPAEFQAALIDRLVLGTQFSDREPQEDEAELLVNELAALRPELTHELMEAVAGLS